MAHTLPPFPSFNIQATDANNIGLEWAKWVDRFENFLVAYNITADVRKKALLLHYAGEEVYDLYTGLSPTRRRQLLSAPPRKAQRVRRHPSTMPREQNSTLTSRQGSTQHSPFIASDRHNRTPVSH
ncbi:unnamed protein product [Ixodes hexagonus]